MTVVLIAQAEKGVAAVHSNNLAEVSSYKDSLAEDELNMAGEVRRFKLVFTLVIALNSKGHGPLADGRQQPKLG